MIGERGVVISKVGEKVVCSEVKALESVVVVGSELILVHQAIKKTEC